LLPPPPPHDPRERERVFTHGAWEIRLFTDRKFAYFVGHGLWHIQLWNPDAQVSILTPSRLTRGFFEAYPVAECPARAADFHALGEALEGEFPALDLALPTESEVAWLRKVFVDDVVAPAHLVS
jgi:hypothetical protein